MSGQHVDYRVDLKSKYHHEFKAGNVIEALKSVKK